MGGRRTEPEVWWIVADVGDATALERTLASLRELDDRSLSRCRIVDARAGSRVGALNQALRAARAARRESPLERALFHLIRPGVEVPAESVKAAWHAFEELGWTQTGLVAGRVISSRDPDEILWGGSLGCFPFEQFRTGRVSRGDAA